MIKTHSIKACSLITIKFFEKDYPIFRMKSL